VVADHMVSVILRARLPLDPDEMSMCRARTAGDKIARV
jgi:hypothetical protein